MEYRNSSGTHFSGDFAVGVGSSHGVEFTGGSTGGTIRPASDDASAALNVRAKGASGVLNLGTSTSGALNLAGSAVASASPWSITGSSFSVVGASSIVLSPTSTAGITIGNSSNQNHITMIGSSIAMTSTHVNLNSTRISLGGGASTTALSGFKRVRVDFVVPEIAANAAVLDSTFTAVGLTTNALMMFHSDALAAVLPNTVDVSVRCSTTDEGRLVFRNIAASTIGTGLSTSHGYLAWFNF